jgi:calcineurin-like phosphoesterase family protein
VLWFTADTHFGHAAIIEHCWRPFVFVEQMDEALVERLNACVASSDTLYHLGDFAWSGRLREFRERIACRHIHLVIGNHDRDREVRAAVRDGLLDSAQEYLRLKVDGLKLVLCHYPFQFWRPGYIHLHGHSHGSLVPQVPGRRDVGVDASGFAPVSLDAIREIQVPVGPDGRHGERHPEAGS